MQLPKRILPLLLFCGLTSILFAQKKEITTTAAPKSNIVKINLSALVFKNISMQYERKVAKSISVAANVRYMPFAKLPFLNEIEKAIDDPSVPVDRLRVGAIGITPEVRFYVGHKGALRGFYIAPFANYTKYQTDLPLNYSSKTGIFNGDIAALTGGILFGAQWNLGKSVTLDWWVVGPNYGHASGDLVLSTTLSPLEQTELRNQIENLKADAPFDKLIDSYTVSSTGATMKAKGPWAGLRGLGINIGFRF